MVGTAGFGALAGHPEKDELREVYP